MERKELIRNIRVLWKNLSMHQKIMFLKYVSRKSESVGKWEKMIPRPMSELDQEFKNYTASQMEKIFARSKRVGEDELLTESAHWFVFDNSLGIITPVYNIDTTVAKLFEKMVKEEGMDVIKERLTEAFPGIPDPDGALQVITTKGKMKSVLENIPDDEPLRVSIEPNGHGMPVIQYEAKEKVMTLGGV